MAWLGSTLGDGLTSLKGQITKITKDVLAEDPLGSTSFEGRIKELEEICEAHAEENKQLREENAALKSGKSFEWSDDQFQDVCALETQISELTLEKKRLERLLEEYDADYQKELENILKDRDHWKTIAQKNGKVHSNSHVNSIEELTAAINQLNVQNCILLEESKSREKEIEFYKAELLRLEEEHRSSKPKLASENNFTTQNNIVRKQTLENVSLLTAESKNLEEEVRNLRRIIEEKEMKIDEYAEKLESIRNENHRLTNEREVFDTENASLIMEKAELETLVKDMQASVDELQTNLQKERQSVSEFKAKNSGFISTLEKLQTEKESSEKKLTTLIESLQSEHINLLKDLKEKSGSNEEHIELSGIIDGLKAEKAKLTEKCQELLEEINLSERSMDQSLKEEKQKAEEFSIMCDNLRIENTSLQNKLDCNKSTVQALAKENDVLREKVSSYENFTRAVNDESELKRENSELKERLRSLKALNKAFEERFNQAKLALETLKTENMRLESAMNKLEASSASKEEIELLNKELDAFQEDIKSLTAKMEEKDKQLNEFSKGTGKLALENAELVRKLKELSNRGETDSLTAEIASLRDQIGSLNAVVEEKDKQLKILKEEVNKLSEDKTELLNNTENDAEMARLTEEVATLEANLTAIASEKDRLIKQFNEDVKLLAQEKAFLDHQLQEITILFAGKIPVAPDWMKALEDELVRLVSCVGASVPEPMNFIVCLGEINKKVCHLLDERCAAGSNTLGLEIRKLKGLVNRIRREFMLSATEGGQLEADADVDEQGENLLAQSQTDDVKRLKQDVTQMTEILGMIDRGLTSILQDKGRLEKELVVLQSMYAKTEKELTTVSKTRDLWNMEKKQLLDSIEMKEADLELLISAKRTAEQEAAAAKSKTLEMEKSLQSTLEEKSNIETQLKLLEERLNENEVLREKLERLESVKQTGQNVESPQDFTVETIMPNLDAEESERGVLETNWKDIALELKTRCEDLERKCKDSDERNDFKDIVMRLQQENTDLKSLVQQLRENIFIMGTKHAGEISDESHSQQHRRSLSQTIVDSSGGGVEALRAEMTQERGRYQTLQLQNQALIEKEAGLRKELERLREHLMEVEEHYTTEAVETEQKLNEYRSKLASAEDQLRNSSTVYKSANVRSTQHLEALQNQIRLMSVQRDDLQTKLSIAEDQMQKQSAALASLQMVLEQFQLDKEREMQAASIKYEYQLELAGKRSAELEADIRSLQEQLAEAKNGLKAALRLGEQLDKKSQQISTLEEELKRGQLELCEAQKMLAAANESTAGKIDKFLVKNLVLGYLSAGQGNTKAQALKILATVLGLSEEEKAKVGVDSGQSWWLSHLLHPSPGGSASSEPLSQAFIRFLENESRPQPQLKLLPEASANISSSNTKREPLLLSDLVLPTITPTGVSDKTGSALNDVLKDS